MNKYAEMNGHLVLPILVEFAERDKKTLKAFQKHASLIQAYLDKALVFIDHNEKVLYLPLPHLSEAIHSLLIFLRKQETFYSFLMDTTELIYRAVCEKFNLAWSTKDVVNLFCTLTHTQFFGVIKILSLREYPDLFKETIVDLAIRSSPYFRDYIEKSFLISLLDHSSSFILSYRPVKKKEVETVKVNSVPIKEAKTDMKSLYLQMKDTVQPYYPFDAFLADFKRKKIKELISVGKYNDELTEKVVGNYVKTLHDTVDYLIELEGELCNYEAIRKVGKPIFPFESFIPLRTIKEIRAVIKAKLEGGYVVECKCCKKLFHAKSSKAKTCSGACRKALSEGRC